MFKVFNLLWNSNFLIKRSSFYLLMLGIVFATNRSYSQGADYSALFTESTFSRTIDVTKPVGGISSQSGVASGAGSYSIPVAVPPGTNGISPALSLTYNSMSGSGILGMGWSISGLSAITRIPKTIYHDGAAAPVELNQNQTFALDGVRMLLQTGSAGADGATYKTEIEDFSVISSHNLALNPRDPSWFKLVTKDGVAMQYGYTADSRMRGIPNVIDGTVPANWSLYWKLNRITYPDSSYIEFEYENANYESNIKEIRYTGNAKAGITPYNKIQFQYAKRTDQNTFLEAGTPVYSTFLLDKIIITSESNVVKSYKFKYGSDGINSFLKEAIESGANGTELNSTIFKYGDIPTDFVANQSSIILGIESDNSVGDFNGDGKHDLLSADVKMYFGLKYNDKFTIRTKHSSQTPGTDEQYTIIGEQVLPPNSVYTRPSPTAYHQKRFYNNDFTGDGASDVLIIQMANLPTPQLDKFIIYKSVQNTSGTGLPVTFSQKNISALTIYGTTYNRLHPNGNYLVTGDFNGDHIEDLITFLGSSSGDYIPFLHLGGATSSLQITYPASGVSNLTLVDADQIHVLDFNGDGKQDIMFITGNVCQILTLNGDTFQRIYHSNNFLNSNYRVYFGDFNGDRKTDIIAKNSSDASWIKALSSGKHFISSTLYFENRPNTDQYIGDHFAVADFNGDGRSDIYYARNERGANVEIFYSTGDGFKHIASTYPSSIGAPPPIVGDFNGDGRAEVLNVVNYTTAVKFFRFKPEGKELLLEKATDGLNNTKEWVYKTLSSGGNLYTRGALEFGTLRNVQPPLHVVSEYNMPNGLGGMFKTTYTYEGLKFSDLRRRSIGFARISTTDVAKEFKTVSESEFNTTYFAVSAKKNSVYRLPNTAISETTNINVYVPAGNKRYWVKTTDVQETNSLAGTTNTIANEFDNFGNVTKSTTNVSSIESTVTESNYLPFVTNIPNRPELITVTKTRAPDVAFVAKTKHEYDALGRVKKKTEFYLTDKKLVYDYQYFPAGNLKKTTVTGYNGTLPLSARETSLTYDLKFRYPESSVNPLSQVSATTYDPRWGVPLTETGVDGLTVSHQYDEFGNLIKTTPRANNPSYTINYVMGWGTGAQPLYYHNTAQPGKPDRKVWFDVLGREVKNEIEAYPTGTVSQTTTYDSKGNLHITTEPFKVNESYLKTANLYDEYNRIQSVTTSNNSNAVIASTSIAYAYVSGNLTTTTTAPTGVTSKTTDASEQVIQATDNGGTLSYTYYSHGGLQEVKLANYSDPYSITSLEYDVYGRQNKLIEQNSGTTLYDYDAYGELISQTRANNVTYTMKYDVLGRITEQKKADEPATQYKYFSAGAGINQIEKITGFAGNTEDYIYDSYGRLQSLTETVDGQAHQISYGYNAYDDMTAVTYPSGLKTTHAYDPNGYPTTIQANTSPAAVLYSTTNVNGRGQVTSFSRGNQTSAITYTNGFPTQYLSGAKQNLNLVWDYGKGTLTSRNDAVKALTEEFTYDPLLNRLETTKVGSTTLTTTYKKNGNIDYKHDAGLYLSAYSNHIHSASNPSPAPFPNRQQDISYTSFSQPYQITEKNSSGVEYQLTYTYGADHERRKSVLAQNGNLTDTKYYLSGYDKYTDSGTAKYAQYIYSPVGLIAIIESNATGGHQVHYTYTDHLGSILTVTDAGGTIEAEQSFDAWGRRRNPSTWALIGPTAYTSSKPWLFRGYTGHEHLDQFGLINMNARLYDPVLGRMLSPDNLVPDPFDTQSFNRYSYAFNNPLIYTDPDGQLPILPFIIAAVAGGGSNLYTNWNKVSSFSMGLAYFGNGAVGGAISVVNPIAGGAATAAMNIGTDIVTGNLPKFNDGSDLAAYAFGQVTSGLSVAGTGSIGTQITNTIRNSTGKAPLGYAWAKVGGGDLVMADNGFVQGVGTNSRVLVEVGKNAAKGGESFFEGAKYSNKVIRQMGKTDDLVHAFPKSVDGYATKFGQWSTKIGGDGKTYQWLKMPGSYGGKTGVFEYTKDANGLINHRFLNITKAP